ncbi:MAG: glycosyltransferase family 1 protein, partial [Rhodospirillales bacterium]
MRVLILNTDYPAFLDRHYGRNAHLCQASYADQMTARNKSLFGSADFYSRGLAAHGNQAIEIHANNAYLQSAWGREYKLLPVNFLPPPPPTPVADYLRLVGRRLGLPLRKRHRIEPWMQDILKAQIASFRPDVILNQDMYQFTGDFLKNAGSNGMLIVGQIAAALPQHGNYSSYDLIVSSLPNLVAHFRALGIKAERNDLAFDPSVLASLEAPKVRSGAVFIGNFSKDHGRRIALIETLCLQTDKVEVWGGGLAALDRNSPIRARHKGEVYGVEMYRVLASAEIAINIIST